MLSWRTHMALQASAEARGPIPTAWAGLGFLLCLAGGVLAVPWRRSLRQPATRELSVFWRARIALQVSGALWLVRPHQAYRFGHSRLSGANLSERSQVPCKCCRMGRHPAVRNLVP